MQGLIAGVNAARRAQELSPVTLPRNSSYMGTLLDDLVTKVHLVFHCNRVVKLKDRPFDRFAEVIIVLLKSLKSLLSKMPSVGFNSRYPAVHTGSYPKSTAVMSSCKKQVILPVPSFPKARFLCLWQLSLTSQRFKYITEIYDYFFEGIEGALQNADIPLRI